MNRDENIVKKQNRRKRKEKASFGCGVTGTVTVRSSTGGQAGGRRANGGEWWEWKE
jgi:hypothetical protein